MDFNDTADEARYRTEVREFLARHGSLRSATVATPPVKTKADSDEILAASRAWQRVKYEAGYAAITWAREVGGQSGTAMQQVIYDQEEAKFDVPSSRSFAITFGMCIPTLLAYGSEEQKTFYTERALTGKHIWCQLFSEPSAGSDVAGLRMRAEKQGDKWILNGQKTWTSGAHYADFGVLVARSDPSVPKHKGLTYFFIDMKSAGIDIRPIKQITGDAHFNDVYFTDVVIPDTQRLGAVGKGWEVALTTLMNERTIFASLSDQATSASAMLELARSIELESGPAIANQLVRERIADWYLKDEGVRLTSYRTMTSLSRGEVPGPESSISKAVLGPAAQDAMAFALDLQEMGGVICAPALSMMQARWQEFWLFTPSRRVAGGTDEIMRNIIAERILGMPGDIRVDKDVPFNKLPSGR